MIAYILRETRRFANLYVCETDDVIDSLLFLGTRANVKNRIARGSPTQCGHSRTYKFILYSPPPPRDTSSAHNVANRRRGSLRRFAER